MGRYRVDIIYTHASTGHKLVTVSLPQSEEYEKWRCWVRGFEFCGPPLGDEGTSTRSRNVPAIPAQKASFRIGFVQWVFDCLGRQSGWLTPHISCGRISLASLSGLVNKELNSCQTLTFLWPIAHIQRHPHTSVLNPFCSKVPWNHLQWMWPSCSS